MGNYFTGYLNKKVKVLFLDDGRSKVIVGILNESNDHYIVVDNVAIGLGQNFISCIPQEGE